METLTIATLVLVATPLFAFIFIYNTMVGRKNQVQFAFGSLDTQLKKRFDLIPNLVATVERYMQHEQQLLYELTSLRSAATRSDVSTDDLVKMDNKLTSALRSVFALAENYPQLRAGENFLHLQRSLNEVEEQIAAARRAYNAAVTEFNNGCEMFPLNVVAKMMGYTTKAVFEIKDSERENPDVAGIWS